MMQGMPSHISNAGKYKKLILEWRCFVASVRQGYKFGIHDYTNDLAVRDSIQKLLSDGFTPSPQLKKSLFDIDQELKALLVPLKKPMINNVDKEKFWYFGLPLSSNSELLEDAYSLGFLEDDVEIGLSPVDTSNKPPIR